MAYRNVSRASASSFRQFLHSFLGNQSGERMNRLARLRYFTSKYFTTNAGSASKLRIGTFVAGSLAASRGLSFWSAPAKEEEPKAPELSPEEIAIAEADQIYKNYEFLKLYDLLIAFKDSNNAELIWRLARACRDVAQMTETTKERKKELTYAAYEYAKKAVELNDENFAAHKWVGITLSDVGDYEGTKKKINDSYVIKDEFQRAIDLNPNDATSKHLLGQWCYTVAELPWYQQKIAAAIFGTPPKSTYEEALRWFTDAEQTDPNFYSRNHLWLGMTYLKLNNKKMALYYFIKARDYPPKKDEDYQVQKEAKEYLSKISS
ncbi:regulator of microtubule dynamics protein 1-like [Amphiura filiformis]|uniref:regulator of microtubule dynamics protein 1-like n=1 Tax=Amphiura filiformis TaxID=82378 RepID=UPI003B20BB66